MKRINVDRGTESRIIPLTAAIHLASLVWLGALGSASAHSAAPADHLFVGDNIITMVSEEDRPGALAVRGQEILWVGDPDDAARWIGPETQRHELGERALLPGFIDAHGHLTFLAATLSWANLASPPVGPVTDMSSLQEELRSYISRNQIPPGSWVIGNGYDDSLITEQAHPDRRTLDAVSDRHPIVLMHVSGHLMAANSLALSRVGIDAETTDPAGGHIRRQPGSNIPNGVLEETATYPLRAKLGEPRGNPMENLATGLERYASYGITTVQDGAISEPFIGLLKAADAAGALNLDVVIYPVVSNADTNAVSGMGFGSYLNRLKFGGVKMVLDGSPQGKTAYLTHPYHVPPAGQSTDYRGYPIYSDQATDAMVASYLQMGIPIIAHANGDAAADQLIIAVAKAAPESDHRTVMIHAQTVREDQLDDMAKLGMVPSYFSAHTFFWGDWHRDSVLGPERAARISPTRSTLDRDMPFTVHNDAPIVPPDMIRLLWATTNRQTRSGAILGPEQRLSSFEALTAMTSNAAYQYFEESRKGTLEAGKQADLVILSENPLTTPSEELLRLKVDQTWSRGVRVFSLNETAPVAKTVN